MNMLCGLFSPTQGEIRMNGQNIATDEGKKHRREHLGVCPQHDVLWNRLTVWEHLVFFAVIKGMTVQDAERAASDMLGELALAEKRNKYVAGVVFFFVSTSLYGDFAQTSLCSETPPGHGYHGYLGHTLL
jgi:ABC-type multidrug transport system ATPase subunit